MPAVKGRSFALALAAERERIAQDIHDTAGQTLYGIGLKLQDLLHDVTDSGTAERIAEVRALAAQGVADVRSAMYALSLLHVRESGLLPSLRALCRQFECATGVEINLRTGTLPKLSEAVESAFYRMAHEALVNVDRHARATGVSMSLAVEENAVILRIRDDGVGLDQRQAREWRSTAHFGLRTMARSIQQAGGRFSMQAVEPRGLLLAAAIPLRIAS